MGFDGNFDHYILSEELDFASYDFYIGQGHPEPLYSNMANDLTRGFKRKNFWIMETQPGAVNWARINNTLDKGEIREMAWSDIGHGADAVSYWQWRSAPNGQEQYHGTLLGADGTPRPLYDEVAQVGREFAKLSEVFRGTSPVPQTAIIHDYSSRWAIDFQRHNRDFDPVQYLFTFYRPLRQMTQDVDIVSPTAPLSQYKLVVAPALNILPEATAQHLAEYVKNGGHLVIGARSGMKDEYNTLLPSRQPGNVLNKLLAGGVVDFYALDKPVPVNGKVGNGEARIWAELLEAKEPSVEVLLSYGKSNGWLDGKPAVITRRVGSGQITYVGAQLDDAVMDGIARRMIADSGVKPVFGPVPAGVDVSRRVGNGKEVFVLVNYTAETQTIPMPKSMRELLKDTLTTSTLTLEPHGVAVLVPAQ
jgi:beta-galactosidase